MILVSGAIKAIHGLVHLGVSGRRRESSGMLGTAGLEHQGDETFPRRRCGIPRPIDHPRVGQQQQNQILGDEIGSQRAFCLHEMKAKHELVTSCSPGLL
jgi:hypothetical protein